MLLDVGAQPVGMVEADGTDDGRLGIDDVDRIEPPAEPHLEHREVRRRAARNTYSAASALYSKKVSVMSPRAASMASKAATSSASLASAPSTRMRSL